MPYTAHNVVEWTGYLFHPEVDALAELAQSLPTNPVVVNIGAGNGTSGLALLQSRPDLFLWTVDKQLESSPFGCLEGEWAVFDKAGLWPCVRYAWIHGDSIEAGQKWSKAAVDLVFVDGDPSYAGCSGDILAWYPNIRSGGLLVVHDYRKEERFAKPIEGKAPHPKPWHGVEQAVDKYLVGKFEIVAHVDTLIAFRVPAEKAKRETTRKRVKKE